ncbi:MAG: endopeptidase La [Legionellales bacterium]|nr:endopeptidase La [Legionellales bacterium]|tara:strand:+ start:5359 stop:7812 length:2454 start_codon:yes stop_codon:yes gene_type:complete
MGRKVKESDKVSELPVLPLRDVVVFPHMVIPLFVGRPKSIQALEMATSTEKQIFLSAQKFASQDDPDVKDIYEVGCIATILQLLKLPDGTVKVLVEGTQRGKVLRYTTSDPCHTAIVEELSGVELASKEGDVLSRSLLTEFDQYVKLNKKIPPEILTSLAGIEETGRLADSIASHMTLKIEEKQKLLETVEIGGRVEELIKQMQSEVDLLEVENRIRSRVKRQMEKSQKEYYLNEQIKAIQKELGDGDEAHNELEELNKKIKKLPQEAREKAESEMSKLKAMPPMSAEATVSRNYLDVLVNLPWEEQSDINHDLGDAEDILDADHYGLEEVKERIIEYLAVQQRVKKIKGPVLCLVGPPGVGKTSLGESIARATGREYVRVALGGVRDEAEIRGHRRTYIGALPGKVIQKLDKVGVRNPLFLFDEVDKMAMDFRGDPASALLEVLDPEQNNTFNDHYLEVDFDLSDVMFVCTANTLNIPAALLDRMEVIRLPGYTEDEKVNIAIQHLIPKQMEQNGLTKSEISFSEAVLREIIRYYTREAGVRGLERELAKVCRKVVKEIVGSKTKRKSKKNISQRNIEEYLGVKRHRYGIAEAENRVGQVTGLAWTEVGGELLTVEGVCVDGKGKTSYTGQLGDVMQESIQAALTVVRSRAQMLGIQPNFYTKKDIHVHVPEGATPKDGPSAGVAMCTALVSVLTGIPVKASVAMTGEITLRGEVLPIGGLKEKLLAAHRGGIKTVVIPEENERDLTKIPENITGDLDIRPVRWIDEVLAIALEEMPTSLRDDEIEPFDKSDVGEPKITTPKTRKGSKKRNEAPPH